MRQRSREVNNRSFFNFWLEWNKSGEVIVRAELLETCKSKVDERKDKSDKKLTGIFISIIIAAYTEHTSVW